MRCDEIDYDKFVTPFPERIGRCLKLPYGAVWMLLFSTLVSARLFTIFIHQEPLPTIIPSIGFAFLPCALGYLIVIYSKLLEQFTPVIQKLLDQSPDDTVNWCQSELKSIFNDKWMISSGLALTIIYLPITMQGGFFPKALPSQMVFLITMAAMSFMGGAMLSVMFGITRFLWKFGQEKCLKILLFSDPTANITSVGNLLGKMAIYLMVVYFITVLSMIPVKIDTVSMILAFVFAIVVVAFFIIPQIKIHDIMVKSKYKRISTLSPIVEQALEALHLEPTKENARHIQHLFDIHRGLNEVDEWPFNHRLLLSVVGSIVVPLIVCLVTFFSNRAS